jgi:2,5-diamino-6-(ribosylamino)-4(3H)-pyrimidinone 5'-phosphate reductase
MSLERLLDLMTDAPEPDDLYTRLDFPEPPAERPYLFINMASTVDGKIVVGEPGGTAKGVGGPTDQRLFRRLQKRADAALLGSATLRASHVLYPPEIPRFVVTRSGDVPLQNRFFTDAPDRAWALVPEDIAPETKTRLEASAHILAVGKGGVDLKAAMRSLRQEQGIRYLLCEGGATLNDDLIRSGLADELFLTLAPKLKGGAHLPTIMTGQGFAPNVVLPLHLRSLYRDDDELYLRYRLDAPQLAFPR